LSSWVEFHASDSPPQIGMELHSSGLIPTYAAVALAAEELKRLLASSQKEWSQESIRHR
jgi:hypothetical protein